MFGMTSATTSLILARRTSTFAGNGRKHTLKVKLSFA
jgi:hypothetical protein